MVSLDEIVDAHLSINDQSTHWEGCETSHVRCALRHLILRVQELEQAIVAHRKANAGQFHFMTGGHDDELWQKVRTG